MNSTQTPRPNWARHLDDVALILVRLGRRLLGRPDEQNLTNLSERTLHSSLDSPPTDALTHGRRAFRDGRHSEALHHFSRILEENPDHAWAWHGRGDALQLLGAWQDALTAYERAISLQPEEPLHQNGRRNALQAMGQRPNKES